MFSLAAGGGELFLSRMQLCFELRAPFAALACSYLPQAWSRLLWQQFYPWSIRGWKPDSMNHSQSSLLHRVILNVHVLKSSEVVILSAVIRIPEKSYENIMEVLELGRSFQGW